LCSFSQGLFFFFKLAFTMTSLWKKSEQECSKLRNPHKTRTGLWLNLPWSSTNNIKEK
jgi:hypothetical protein